MTAPFKADAEALIREKADHLFSAKAFPKNGQPFGLDVKRCNVSMDESWTPHARSSITCALPDADQLALLDARIGCRVQITTGYRYGKDDEESYLLVDLHLRSREIDHGAGVVTLDLESDESLLIDHILYGTESVDRSDLFGFVSSVLELTGPEFSSKIYSFFGEGEFAKELAGETIGKSGGVFVGTPNEAKSELEPVLGGTAWSLIEEAQRRTGTWVYCQNGRDWVISERAEITATPLLSLTVGEEGTILVGKSVLSRNNFYNEVIFRYEWRDETRLPADRWVLGSARITGGPFSVNSIARQTYVETIDRRASQTEADIAARDKLSRLLTKGYEFTVRAVAAYWLRAGDTVSLTLDGKTEKVLVKTINFEPDAGTMSLVLRKPEHATLSTEF